MNDIKIEKKGRINRTPIKLKKKCVKAKDLDALLAIKLAIKAVIHVPILLPIPIATAVSKEIKLFNAKLTVSPATALLLCIIPVTTAPNRIARYIFVFEYFRRESFNSFIPGELK